MRGSFQNIQKQLSSNLVLLLQTKPIGLQKHAFKWTSITERVSSSRYCKQLIIQEGLMGRFIKISIAATTTMSKACLEGLLWGKV